MLDPQTALADALEREHLREAPLGRAMGTDMTPGPGQARQSLRRRVVTTVQANDTTSPTEPAQRPAVETTSGDVMHGAHRAEPPSSFSDKAYPKIAEFHEPDGEPRLQFGPENTNVVLISSETVQRADSPDGSRPSLADAYVGAGLATDEGRDAASGAEQETPSAAEFHYTADQSGELSVSDALQSIDDASAVIQTDGATRLSNFLTEDSWWLLYIDPRHHEEALSAFKANPEKYRDVGRFYDEDLSPGFQESMVAAYREALDRESSLSERMTSGIYERMHKLVTRNLRGEFRWTGWGHTNFPIRAGDLNADLLDERLLGRRVVAKVTDSLLRKEPGPPPITILNVHEYSNPVISTNYRSAEAPVLVDAIFDRYYKEIEAAGGDDRLTLSAIARTVRTLQVIHPFTDANRRLNVQLLLFRFLLEQGLPPVISTNLHRLFQGGYSIAEIVASLEECISIQWGGSLSAPDSEELDAALLGTNGAAESLMGEGRTQLSGGPGEGIPRSEGTAEPYPPMTGEQNDLDVQGARLDLPGRLEPDTGGDLMRSPRTAEAITRDVAVDTAAESAVAATTPGLAQTHEDGSGTTAEKHPSPSTASRTAFTAGVPHPRAQIIGSKTDSDSDFVTAAGSESEYVSSVGSEADSDSGYVTAAGSESGLGSGADEGRVTGSGEVVTDRWLPFGTGGGRGDSLVDGASEAFEFGESGQGGARSVVRPPRSGERTEVQYAWRYRESTDGAPPVLHITQRILLRPGGNATPEDLSAVRAGLEDALKNAVNQRAEPYRLPDLQPGVIAGTHEGSSTVALTGPVLRLHVEWVDTPEAAHFEVTVHPGLPGRGAMNQRNWYAQVNSVALLHEYAHGLGVRDDSPGPNVLLVPGGSAPRLPQGEDGPSLMGTLSGTTPAAAFRFTHHHLRSIAETWAPFAHPHASAVRAESLAANAERILLYGDNERPRAASLDRDEAAETAPNDDHPVTEFVLQAARKQLQQWKLSGDAFTDGEIKEAAAQTPPDRRINSNIWGQTAAEILVHGGPVRLPGGAPEGWYASAAHEDDLRRIRYLQAAQDFDARLGRYLVQRPQAVSAVREAVQAIWRLIEQATPHLLRTMGGNGQVSGSIGNDVDVLREAASEGNMRELVSMLFSVVSKGEALERFIKLPSYSMWPWLTEERRWRRDNKGDVRRMISADSLVPPPSHREVAAAGVRGNDGRLYLRWESAADFNELPLNAPLHQDSGKSGGLVVSGSSGSLLFILEALRQLQDVSGVRFNFPEIRLGLIGGMLVGGHHSAHELMRSAASWSHSGEYGFGYFDGWSRYRYLVPLTEQELREHVAKAGLFPDEIALGLDGPPSDSVDVATGVDMVRALGLSVKRWGKELERDASGNLLGAWNPTSPHIPRTRLAVWSQYQYARHGMTWAMERLEAVPAELHSGRDWEQVVATLRAWESACQAAVGWVQQMGHDPESLGERFSRWVSQEQGLLGTVTLANRVGRSSG
ncbi:hypothetical protein ACWDBO_54005 [Streptomyces mirabilis]